MQIFFNFVFNFIYMEKLPKIITPMEIDKPKIEQIIRNKGFEDFKWIYPGGIIISQWVRMKCMYGCESYNLNGTCPPNVPSVDDCRKFLQDYDHGLILRFSKLLKDPADRKEYCLKINKTLLKIEREVFLAGYRKAFVLFTDECHMCADCTGKRDDCKNKKDSRPSPESLAVDVFKTVSKYDFPINVLKDYDEVMNRYSILLVE
jgi:predicted metal-binding protein